MVVRGESSREKSLKPEGKGDSVPKLPLRKRKEKERFKFRMFHWGGVWGGGGGGGEYSKKKGKKMGTEVSTPS